MTDTLSPEPPRRLERSASGRMIGGVAAGLGRHLGIDPVIVRIAFAVSTLFGGAGLVAYLAAWALIPDEGAARAPIASVRLRWSSRTSRIVLGATLLTIAAAIALGSVDAVSWDVASGAAVVVLGIVLLAASFSGGARWLFLPALLLFGCAGLAHAADVHLKGGIGDRTIHVSRDTPLAQRYELGIGHLALDLSDMTLPASGVTHLRARLGVGDLEVTVPDGVTVRGSARNGAGEVVIFGHHADGTDVERATLSTPAVSAGTIELDADIGIGELRVHHASGDVDQ